MSGIANPMREPPPGVLYATSVLVKNIERQADPDRSAAVVHNLIEQEVIVQRRQSNVESSMFVARSMHRRVDRHVRERDERDPEGTAEVQCRRGCTMCCYQNVTLSEPEARLAFQAAVRAEHVIDIERVRKQAPHDVADYQALLSHAERRCVMLKDDGDCAIYADRPNACRLYRVVSPPSDCDTESNVHGGVLALTTPHAEVVVSAAMREFRYGSLPAFILEFVFGMQS